MDIVVMLVAIVAGFALLAFLASDGAARSLDSFAAGFLPYRGAGWPQGVQEEDPVAWSWSSVGESNLPGQGSDSALEGGPEIVEISDPGASEATEVDPGPMLRGTATRRE